MRIESTKYMGAIFLHFAKNKKWGFCETKKAKKNFRIYIPTNNAINSKIQGKNELKFFVFAGTHITKILFICIVKIFFFLFSESGEL